MPAGALQSHNYAMNLSTRYTFQGRKSHANKAFPQKVDTIFVFKKNCAENFELIDAVLPLKCKMRSKILYSHNYNISSFTDPDVVFQRF